METERRGACPDDNLLAALLDRALDSDELAQLSAHVDECDRCHRVVGISMTAKTSALSTPSPTDTTALVQVAKLKIARTLPPGTILGRYVIERWLGEGAAGVVYAARDPELDRRVALKVVALRESEPDEASLRASLLREARAMAQLAHPNVVSIYEAGAAQQCVYLAMELVEGATLRAWLRAETRDAEAIVDRFVKAGRGLAAAHRAGLVHRDFKPDNVLVALDGRVHVTDFGLAYRSDPVFAALAPEWVRAFAGTPSYMAPEQKEGAAADARSDQYSFCVSLHEALLGEKPASQRTSRSLRVGRVPSRVRRVLARGLQPKPEDRYLSMDALLDDLTRRPLRRRSVAIVLTVMVAMIAALSLFVGRSLRAPVAADVASVCNGGESRLSGIWDSPRKAALRRAFLAVDTSYAAGAWDTTSATLDRYAAEWTTMHRDSCEATHVRHEQSEALLDLRTRCLNERLDGMRALTDVLSSADASVVLHAPAAAQSLPRIAACGDVQALTAPRGRASGPAMVTRAEAIRREIAGIKALDDAGRYADALPRAKKSVEDARATDDRGLAAEALLRYGLVRDHMGELPGAEGTLYEAAWAADASGDDRLRTRIWAHLLFVVATEEARPGELPHLRDQGLAALARGGHDDEAEAALLNALGTSYLSLGDMDEATRTLESALVLSEKAYGPDGVDVAYTLSNLGLAYSGRGSTDEAGRVFLRAIAVGSRALGPRHPNLAVMQGNLAAARSDLLDFEGAVEASAAAVDIAEASLGADHLQLALPLANLGESLSDAGRPAEAVPPLLRALRIQERALPADHPRIGSANKGLGKAYLGLGEYHRATLHLERALTLAKTGNPSIRAETQFLLAKALTAEGREPLRATTLAREAEATFATGPVTPATRALLGLVRAWLAAAGTAPKPHP